MARIIIIRVIIMTYPRDEDVSKGFILCIGTSVDENAGFRDPGQDDEPSVDPCGGYARARPRGELGDGTCEESWRLVCFVGLNDVVFSSF